MAAFSAGQTLTAADLIAILPVFAYKTADESVISSTTLQNDDHLVVAGVANRTYRVECELLVAEAAGTGIDIKCAWTQPSGCVLDLRSVGPHTAWNGSAANLEIEWSGWQNETGTTTASKAFGTNTVTFSYTFAGLWRVGGTGGNLQLQWAQNVSTGSNLTVKSGSSLSITPWLS